jgi:hypothetical protein
VPCSFLEPCGVAVVEAVGSDGGGMVTVVPVRDDALLPSSLFLCLTISSPAPPPPSQSFSSYPQILLSFSRCFSCDSIYQLHHSIPICDIAEVNVSSPDSWIHTQYKIPNAYWLHAVIPCKTFGEDLLVHTLYDAAARYLTRLILSDHPCPNGSVSEPIMTASDPTAGQRITAGTHTSACPHNRATSARTCSENHIAT